MGVHTIAVHPQEEPARVAATHRAALAALRRAAAALGPAPEPAALPGALEAALAEGAEEPGAEGAREVALLYVYGARVGGAAASDPALAARWLAGWSAARSRTPAQARAALTEGIRFGERVHRAMGIAPEGP